MINELFFQNDLIDKAFDGTERVILLNRELTDLKSRNLAEDIRLLIEKTGTGIFHMECESSPGDTRVMLRVVHYNARSSLSEMEIQDGCIHIRIDNSGVLFLRSTENTPKLVKVIVEIPQNESVSYQIPALKMQDYTIDVMLQKKLYILLPFLFFNYEKKLDKVDDPVIYSEIESVFNDTIQRLKALPEQNVLSAYEASTLYEALKVVVEALAKKHNATKEVNEVMGSTILEFSNDKIYNEGKAEGKNEGSRETKQILRTLYPKLIAAGRTADFEKCMSDDVFLDQLCKEFQIA